MPTTFVMPTVGRIVWYYIGRGGFRPYAAIVTCVNGTGSHVEVFVFPPGRALSTFACGNVPFVQDGQEPPFGGDYCTWIGQARKPDPGTHYDIHKGKNWEADTEALGLVVHHDEPLCDGPRKNQNPFDPFQGH